MEGPLKFSHASFPDFISAIFIIQLLHCTYTLSYKVLACSDVFKWENLDIFMLFQLRLLKMKFHKHLAGNMNQLPELFPNRVYKGQDTMVWNTHTEGIVMKGPGLWASLRIMHELWLNQRTPFRESQQWLWHHSCGHCNRKGERSSRQLSHTMPASWKKIPNGWSPAGALGSLCHNTSFNASPLSPQFLALPVPWADVQG